jgi:hypothetical protein
VAPRRSCDIAAFHTVLQELPLLSLTANADVGHRKSGKVSTIWSPERNAVAVITLTEIDDDVEAYGDPKVIADDIMPTAGLSVRDTAPVEPLTPDQDIAKTGEVSCTTAEG